MWTGCHNGAEDAIAVVTTLDGERDLDGRERMEAHEHAGDRKRGQIAEVHRVREADALQRLGQRR